MSTSPECHQCKSNSSEIWHKSDESVLCNICHDQQQDKENQDQKNLVDTIKAKQEDTNEDSQQKQSQADKTTKSGHTKKNIKPISKTVKKVNNQSKSSIPKGKSRRNVFKKHVYKAPPSIITPMTSSSVYFNGMYYQIGDIVSLQDVGGGTYYAQIRGLMTDQYCEKSAVISWLIPTRDSPPPSEGFDPTTYLLGRLVYYE